MIEQKRREEPCDASVSVSEWVNRQKIENEGDDQQQIFVSMIFTGRVEVVAQLERRRLGEIRGKRTKDHLFAPVRQRRFDRVVGVLPFAAADARHTEEIAMKLQDRVGSNLNVRIRCVNLRQHIAIPGDLRLRSLLRRSAEADDLPNPRRRHLLVPNHGKGFKALLNLYLPTWKAVAAKRASIRCGYAAESA